MASWEVRFGEDLGERIAAGDIDIVEISGAPESWYDPPSPTAAERIHFDGERLVLPLGPETTADKTYSTTEVASAPRFDQRHLDRLLAEGSTRIVVPGREAWFDGVLFSPEFGDHRAASETVTAGVCFQSWRGIEEGADNAAAAGTRPAYIGVSLFYVGGPGLVPAIANRSRTRRGLVAVVVDFNTGIQWSQPVDVDPTTAHDVILRWHADRDVSFVVDGAEVARYVDGQKSFSAFKLFRKYRRGINLFGHRHLTADPCHVDAWINCSATGNTPDVFVGSRFSRDLWLGLEGFGIRPIDAQAA